MDINPLYFISSVIIKAPQFHLFCQNMAFYVGSIQLLIGHPKKEKRLIRINHLFLKSIQIIH